MKGPNNGNCNYIVKIRILLRDVPGPHGVPLCHIPYTIQYTSPDTLEKTGKITRCSDGEEVDVVRRKKGLTYIYAGNSDEDGLIEIQETTIATVKESGEKKVAPKLFANGAFILHIPGHDVTLKVPRRVITEQGKDGTTLTRCAYYELQGKELYSRDESAGYYLPKTIPARQKELEGDFPVLKTKEQGHSRPVPVAAVKTDPLLYRVKELSGGSVRRNGHVDLPRCEDFADIPPVTVIADSFWTPFTTFAPMRYSNRVIPFRDGEDHLREAAYLIKNARKFIYIADWMFNPCIPLVRRDDPNFVGDESTLENILAVALANNSALKVYIQAYQSTIFAPTYNNQAYTYLSMQSKLRQYMPAYPFSKLVNGELINGDKMYNQDSRLFFLSHRPGLRWSHHQKIIVADAGDTMQAIIGGVDFCHGRWDAHEHAVFAIPQDISTSGGDRTSGSLDPENLFFSDAYLRTMNEFAHRMYTAADRREEGAVTDEMKEYSLPQKSDMNSPGYMKTHRHLIHVLSLNHDALRQRIANDLKDYLGADIPVAEYPGKLQAYFAELAKTLTVLAQNRKKPWFITYKQLRPEEREAFFALYTEEKKMERLKPQGAQAYWIQTSAFLPGNPMIKYLGSILRTGPDASGHGEWSHREREKLIPQGAEREEMECCLRFMHYEPLADETFLTFLYASPHPGIYPRMPWHDTGCAIVGSAAWDVAEAFAQRWEQCMKDLDQTPDLARKTNEDSPQEANQDPSQNHFESDTCEEPAIEIPNRFFIRTNEIILTAHTRGNIPVPAQTELPDNQNNLRRPDYPARAQIQRSSKPSGGSQEEEQSIYYAYVQAIRNAMHYIYIENQFFCCAKNTIHAEIADRVIKAIDHGEVFRVYILLPLFPEESWDGSNASILDLQQQALWKPPYGCLYRIGEHLLKKGQGKEIYDTANWEAIQEYIGVFSLRSYGKKAINGVSFEMTERIYIHSKCLIVDDRVAIIGSANINDRSMLGDRDTEIAVTFMGDGEYLHDAATGLMNGNPYYARKGVRHLRRELWREHFGDSNPREEAAPKSDALAKVLADPVSDAAWEYWHHCAASNTAYYASTFKALPGPCRPLPESLAPSHTTHISGRDRINTFEPIAEKVTLRDTYLAYLAFHLRDRFSIKVSDDEKGKELELKKPRYDSAAMKIIEQWEARDRDPFTLSPKYGGNITPKDPAAFLAPLLKGHLVYFPLAWMETTDAFNSPGPESSVAATLNITK